MLWKYCKSLSCDIHLQENLKESQPTTHHIIPVKYNYDVLTQFTPSPPSPVWFSPVNLSLKSIHFYAKQLAGRQLITVNIVSLLFYVKSSPFDLFKCWWKSLWAGKRVFSLICCGGNYAKYSRCDAPVTKTTRTHTKKKTITTCQTSVLVISLLSQLRS